MVSFTLYANYSFYAANNLHLSSTQTCLMTDVRKSSADVTGKQPDASERRRTTKNMLCGQISSVDVFILPATFTNASLTFGKHIFLRLYCMFDAYYRLYIVQMVFIFYIYVFCIL